MYRRQKRRIVIVTLSRISTGNSKMIYRLSLTFEYGINMSEIWKWLKNNHECMGVILTICQVIGVILIGCFANNIQSQNYQIQRALYDFEPQISGFCSGIIWVYENTHQTAASIEILINAPHAGNLTLLVNRFYPYEENLDSQNINANHIDLKDAVRDVSYPQAYRFRADVKLLAFIYPKRNTIEPYFYVGTLEFKITYCDIPKNAIYCNLFNGTVWFQFA